MATLILFYIVISPLFGAVIFLLLLFTC